MLTTKRKPATVGEILVEEFMQPMGLTQAALAEAMGVQRKHVNELCNDRRNVTAATALILARVFGNSPDFWLNVQRRSDLWEAMHSPRERERIERARRSGLPHDICRRILSPRTAAASLFFTHAARWLWRRNRPFSLPTASRDPGGMSRTARPRRGHASGHPARRSLHPVASPGRASAGRRSTTFRRGPSPTIGPSACRSRTPRSTCSRHGSAISSMNCSGRADDLRGDICHDRAAARRPLSARLDGAAGRARCLHPRSEAAGRSLLRSRAATSLSRPMSSRAHPPRTTAGPSSSA